MCNLYTKYVIFGEINKNFSNDLVIETENVCRLYLYGTLSGR